MPIALNALVILGILGLRTPGSAPSTLSAQACLRYEPDTVAALALHPIRHKTTMGRVRTSGWYSSSQTGPGMRACARLSRAVSPCTAASLPPLQATITLPYCYGP
jgi:hypothetical protein